MKTKIKTRHYALALLPVTLVAATTTIAAATAQTGGTTLEGGRKTVPHGERLTLRGGGAGPGADVAIEFQRAGGERWSSARTVEANSAGAFSARVRPRYSGAYRAVPMGGTASPQAPVRVRSRLRLEAERYTVVGRTLRLEGRAQPAAERALRIRVGGRTIRTRTNGKGRFAATWRADRTGRFRPSARVAGNKLAAGDSDRGRRVTVYRPASASWYGPGLYGNRMACGGTLSPSTVGVAHRTLPCGTRVRLRNGNRTVTAPVVDRGPYAGNREYDLTSATRQRLGFGSTGTVLASK